MALLTPTTQNSPPIPVESGDQTTTRPFFTPLRQSARICGALSVPAWLYPDRVTLSLQIIARSL